MEQHFRELGCSKRTSRLLVAKLFADADAGVTHADAFRKLFGTDPPGGMPDGAPRWDADNAELESALETLRNACLPKRSRA
jgi:hypothetical protein